MLGFGQALREYSNRLAGKTLSESEFEQWRKDLAERKSIQQELDIDLLLWSKAQQEAKKNGYVVVAGKIATFMKDKLITSLETPTTIAVGVSIDDSIATKRNWKRKHAESVNEPTLEELTRTAQERYDRRSTEQQNFHNTYPDIFGEYSQNSVVKTINFQFDNSEVRTEKEMLQISLQFLDELSNEYPALAVPMTKLLALD